MPHRGDNVDHGEQPETNEETKQQPVEELVKKPAELIRREAEPPDLAKARIVSAG